MKINFRVEITIFTQFDEVQYNKQYTKQCNANKFRRSLEEEYQTHKCTALYSRLVV